MENIRSLVRVFISVAFVLMTAWLVWTGKIDPREVLLITGIIVAYYFGERAGLKVPGVSGVAPSAPASQGKEPHLEGSQSSQRTSPRP